MIGCGQRGNIETGEPRDQLADKKIEVGNGDPKSPLPTSLPGSVVGEPSMDCERESDKITRVIVL
jgi:hypothetical protein